MDVDLAARTIACALLATAIVVAHRSWGWRAANLPLWSALGITALYTIYAFSGLTFGNGRSALAEVSTGLFVLLAVLAFRAGVAMAGGLPGMRRRIDALRAVRFPPVPGWFAVAAVMLSIAFFTVLTDGAPWRVLTEGVELKWVRLDALTEKNALLLNLDALTFAVILFGFQWSIVAYGDDRRSRRDLILFSLLLVLYVVSTGSRSPLLAVVGQAIPAIAVARVRSRTMAAAARRSGLALIVALLIVAVMAVTTGARVEFESLDESVFGTFFDIVDFGVTEPLFRAGNSLAFLAATAIVYAAGTFNNLVLRIQEVAGITPSLGYKFVFFYVLTLRALIGSWLGAGIDDWRDLATINNERLLALSGNANQWATPFGDVVWDFGVAGTFVVITIWFALLGALVARSIRRPSFLAVMLATTAIGVSLLPLVNPLLSLHVHFMILLTLALARQRRRRPRLRSAGVRMPAPIA